MESAETEAKGRLREFCKALFLFFKFCRVEEVLKVKKSLSFFSARVVKSHKADPIDEVSHYKNEDMPCTKNLASF